MKKLYTGTAPESGYILIAMLTTVSFVVVAAVSVASLASDNLRIATSDTYRLAAQLAVDAGADISLQELNSDLTGYSGSGGETPIASTSRYDTTYESTISEIIDDSTRTLTVTGKTYAPAGSTSLASERTYIITLRAVKAGSFSLVSGVGGLTMDNSAKVLGGNVQVNGRLEMKNSAQIGLSSSPVNVAVAHHNCPISGGTGYPSVCPGGVDEPISITNPAWIYGEVRATNQADLSTETLSRMSNTGLKSTLGVASADLPDHARQAQIDNVAFERTGTNASCTANNGSVTWSANTKINGDVTVSRTCTVIVLGDIWITGKLSLQNSGTIRLANGITNPPVIMVDGDKGVVSTNSGRFDSNSSDRGFRVITYYSTATCNPNCADVTGTDLYDSRDITTIDLAQTSSGPNTEFYARWTKVVMGNSGGIGALVGQTVSLTNSAAVTFGAEVSNVNVINGWVVQSYQRSYQ